MGLHLVTGKANAGKSGVVVARLLESLERGESPSLVLPTVADARRAASELAEKAPVGIAVVSWSQWVRGMWALHGDGRRIISRAARAAFVDRALSQAGSGQLPVSAGLRTLLVRAVAEMTIDPTAAHAPSEGLRHVLAVSREYEQLITHAGLIESAAVVEALGRSAPSLTGTVAFNRFADFSASQLRLVRALAENQEVVAALTWERDFEPTRAATGAVEYLAGYATLVQHEPDLSPDDELGRLANGMYSHATLDSDGQVSMGIADGDEAEAALVARHTARAIAEGVKPERIVIAYPRLNARQGLLEGALRAEGIDFETDVVRPLAATSLGRTVLGLLELSLGVGDRATAGSILLGPHSDVSRERAAELDAQWRRLRVEEGRALLRDMARLDCARLGIAADIVRRLTGSTMSEDGSNWQEILELLVSVPLSRHVGSGGSPDATTVVAVQSDAGAAGAIADLVGEMLSVEDTPLTVQDLRAAMREASVGGTRGEREGSVQLTELSRLGSRRFDVVILAGLTADEAPLGSSNGLQDDVRALLTGDPGTPSDQQARFDFYSAVSRARRRLVLVRREADGQGRALRPSVFWDEVLELYRGPDEDRDAWPSGAPPLERLGALRIAESAPVFSRGRREARMAATSSQSAPPAGRGRLVQREAIAALASLEIFSATEIEAYLACPYRWFYERVVRPNELDTEIDARAIGTYAHDLLKRFYDTLPERLGDRRVTVDNLHRCAPLLADIAEEEASRARTTGLAEELSLVRARRWAEGAIADDATLMPGFEPVEHEYSFPGEGEQVVLGGVTFAGRIDRVDRSKDSVFVTDYKTSKIVVGQGRFAEQGKIQAVVYALAARQAFGLPCAGSVYRSLRSRELRGYWRADLLGGALQHGHEDDSLGETAIAALIEETGERVASAVAGIRAGDIARRPARRADCAFCSIRTLCEGSD